MSKYIPADKLIAEIVRRIELLKKLKKNDFTDGSIDAYKGILILIDSFQQKQPMPNSTQLIEFWFAEKEMLKEKDFRGDPWRLAYNAFMRGFGRGIAVNKQEQPEVAKEE